VVCHQIAAGIHAERQRGQEGEGGKDEHLEAHYAKSSALDRLP
jgi:hypothetical protein